MNAHAAGNMVTIHPSPFASALNVGDKIRWMMDEICRILSGGDTFAAIQHVQRSAAGESALDIAKRFDALVRDLYWKARNLPAVVVIARGGIHYSLTKAAEVADEGQFTELVSHAKMLAYNLASFTWPGWDEPGMSPSSCDITAGLDAAKLNLRLAIELKKPVDRLRDAHWLLGAHLLAVNEPAQALDEFHRSNSPARPLFEGYVLLARVVLGHEGAQREFDELLVTMRGREDEESKGNESQLATAHRVFVKSTR